MKVQKVYLEVSIIWRFLLVQRLEMAALIYLSHGPKIFTYEYLPDIFRTNTVMIPPMNPMASKTPTMIPVRVTVDKPPD